MEKFFNTCPRDCYDTCAMITTVEEGKAIKLQGNPRHPITQGFLCWKIQNALKFVYSPQRLKHPLKRVGKKGSDNFREITWEEAYKEIAHQIEDVQTKYGAGAILPFHYFGHMGLLNKQFSQRIFNALGTSDCAPTICSNAGRSALQYVYGGFWGIDPEEIKSSKLIIFWGLNGPWSNLHGYNMVKNAVRNGAKFYVIDPLKTCQLGKHLAIQPNTDGVLALGIANYLITNDLYDKSHVEKYTHGFEQFKDVAKDFDLEKVSRITHLSQEDIRELTEDMYRLRPNFIHLGFGIQKHLYGGEAVRTIALLPPLVGGFRVHYSNTDREIDLGFLQGKHLVSQNPPENKKTYNMAQLGRILETGEIKFLFVFNTNPLVNLPNQRLVKKGMESEDVFTVVHDLFLNDSCSYADIVLPAPSFLESFDIHVCYYHNHMSINQKAIEPLGEAKPNYQVFKELSEAIGMNAKELYPPEHEVAEEFLNRSRAVDFTLKDLEREGFCKMKVRPQDDYLTPTGKIEMHSQLAEKANLPPLPGYYEEVRNEYPFQFLTVNHKRITRSQFHNVWQKEIEPIVLINDEDAKKKDIKEGDWVRLKNDQDTLNMKALPTKDIRQGVILAYGGLWPKLCDGKGANTLISDAVQDFGGNAAYNSTYVEIEKLKV
ncbi:MAG: molybdopterin oxidoreductase, molybdopterin-containing subunit [Candidatus Scalindua rubra]|uniref:Molybdopterin oxidoreductase, molybdopterin-containing subunit n=1 Tax=Candidatus Scalindua rubra TaxID=1872076 RepID=A0A1E3XC22_9BACT|nr:MAG: molybdopterin oxidoreductase, molybdopterin-containing subunit [Candidatus Scalindua rubra]